VDAETPIETPPPISENQPPPRPWGFWATIGFGFLIAVIYVASQSVAMAVLLFAARDVSLNNAASNGVVLAVATMAGLPVLIGSCVGFAWLRKGITVAEYFGLRRPDWRTVNHWIVLLFIVILASDGLTALQDKPIVPDFMIEAYQSAGSFKILLWIVLLIAAPLGEEFLFRGFLFAGLRSSLGVVAAVIVTSLLWAAIHLQYDFYGMATIFGGGILLGFARHKTNSLWTTIILHSVMNLIATLELLVYLHMANA
jgi:uncharacterized protein